MAGYVIEFVPDDELMNVLKGAMKDDRLNKLQYDRDWAEGALICALGGALRELGERIWKRGKSDERKFIGEERLTSDLVLESWVFFQHAVNRLRLLVLVKWYLPGLGMSKADRRHIAELLVWKLWSELLRGATINLDGMVLLWDGNMLSVRVLVTS